MHDSLDPFAEPSSDSLVFSEGRPQGVLAGADLQRLVASMYALPRDPSEWALGVCAAAYRLLPNVASVGMVVFDGRSPIVSVPAPGMTQTRFMLEACGALDGFEARAIMSVVGASADLGVVMILVGERPAKPTPYERSLRARLALHLENALRARTHEDRRVALLSEGGDLASEWLEEELWAALIRGRCSLAPVIEEGGARAHAVIERGQAHASRVLSGDELRVVMHAAKGTPGKVLSYDLGLSTATLSRCLCNAAAKLGVQTSFEVLRVASRLALAQPPDVAEEHLTVTERDVLALVRKGMTNEQIARERGRSTRTVANQVASVLKKTRCPSRRMLITSAKRSASLAPPSVSPCVLV